MATAVEGDVDSPKFGLFLQLLVQRRSRFTLVTVDVGTFFQDQQLLVTLAESSEARCATRSLSRSCRLGRRCRKGSDLAGQRLGVFCKHSAEYILGASSPTPLQVRHLQWPSHTCLQSYWWTGPPTAGSASLIASLEALLWHCCKAVVTAARASSHLRQSASWLHAPLSYLHSPSPKVAASAGLLLQPCHRNADQLWRRRRLGNAEHRWCLVWCSCSLGNADQLWQRCRLGNTQLSGDAALATLSNFGGSAALATLGHKLAVLRAWQNPCFVRGRILGLSTLALMVPEWELSCQPSMPTKKTSSRSKPHLSQS